MLIKYFRGCSTDEAFELQGSFINGKIKERKTHTYWTDSFEKAAMYARRNNGVVVEVEMDENPPGIQNYFSVGAGDSSATTIRQWVIPTDYLVKVFGCYVEESTIHNI